MNIEFSDRFSGRYFGKYRGIVTRTEDPKKIGRIMAVVPSVLGEEEMGLMLPNSSESCGKNTGSYSPANVDDLVWVEFEEGDTSRPIWTGGFWGERAGESMLMEHAKGEPHDTDFSIRDHGVIPPSSFAGTYTDVKIIQGKDGGFLEFDSSEGAHRIQLVHPTGSRLEFTTDGSTTTVATGMRKQRIELSDTYEVTGNVENTYGASYLAKHKGNYTSEVLGTSTHTFRDVNITGGIGTEVWDALNISSIGSTLIQARANASLVAAGQLSVMAGQNYVGTVLENYEMMASGATTGGPEAVVMMNHSLNGRNVLKATDATGAATYATFDANPLNVSATGLATASMFAGTVVSEGGRIDVTAAPVANILLGGYPATEFLVKGTSFMVSLNALTLGLQAFATGVMSDPILAALAPATVSVATALNTVLITFHAQMASQLSWLSTKAATQ
jgi:hypothetical protein